MISKIYNKSVSTDSDLRNILVTRSETGRGYWVDLAGLIAPMDHIERKTKLAEKMISILSD